MLRQPLTYWLPKYPVFWFTLTLTQSVRLPMVTCPSLCSPCVTYRTLCHAVGHQVLPIPAFSVIPHPSMGYRQVFRPILNFQPSSWQSDSWLYPNLLPQPCSILAATHPHPYLGKERIFLGVTIILSLCLCQIPSLIATTFL